MDTKTVFDPSKPFATDPRPLTTQPTGDSEKTWVRFKKSGVPLGFGHFEGDIAEIDSLRAEAGMELGICIAAKPAEIENAKAVTAAEVEAAKSRLPEMSPATLAELVRHLQSQITEMQSTLKPSK